MRSALPSNPSWPPIYNQCRRRAANGEGEKGHTSCRRCWATWRGQESDCQRVTCPSAPAAAAHENSEAGERDWSGGTPLTPQPDAGTGVKSRDSKNKGIRIVQVMPPGGADAASRMSQLAPDSGAEQVLAMHEGRGAPALKRRFVKGLSFLGPAVVYT